MKRILLLYYIFHYLWFCPARSQLCPPLKGFAHPYFRSIGTKINLKIPSKEAKGNITTCNRSKKTSVRGGQNCQAKSADLKNVAYIHMQFLSRLVCNEWKSWVLCVLVGFWKWILLVMRELLGMVVQYFTHQQEDLLLRKIM